MYLNCHSYYSLRYGTLPVEKLVEDAANQHLDTLVLTDINNAMGMPDFVRECKEQNIKPVAGIEFRNKENRLLYIGIARNNEGFKELNDFLSFHNISKTDLPASPPAFNYVYLVFPFSLSKKPGELKENEFVGIRPADTGKLLTSPLASAIEKLVVLQPVTFPDKKHYELHRHLRAIDNNVLLSRLPVDQLASSGEMMLPLPQLYGLYERCPGIISNTLNLLAGCSINFERHVVKNKATFTGSRYDDRILLEKLAREGMEYRYGKNNKEAVKRVAHELEVIDKLGFSSYFLITWDIIRYSMNRGFYHVGRGSGANSVVAYCLRITDVDPIDLDLYFERFINPKRSSPPDFDIDYSWKERDEVIDYIFKRYGHEHTALLGATTTFKGRSIIRELGKVYGLPKQEIDNLVAHPDSAPSRDGISRKIIGIGRMMTGFPNIRSIHAGGILISEKPLTCYTALDMPPKGFPTTQWDMYVAEDLGFEKLDILSQRGIGHIKESVEIILRNRGEQVDVHRVAEFKKDPQVKKQLRNAETTGCFYIESPAMRGLLRKLRCDNYISLVAASSIIRPGVAKSGMMREYILRFHNPDKIVYLHPVMKDQLKETFGVMVYQEDVLKVCHHFAGLDLSDADVLRRAMSGKYRGKKEFERIVQKFFKNCKAKGYPDEITNEVWRQIESFAGYSFSKAHSASFAVESFQSLYLKAHYPLEFMVAVINNFGGFYRTWVYVNEARRQSAMINLPCVNRSDYKTNIYGKDIYLGFVHVSELETQVARQIVAERQQNGDYKSLADFCERVPSGKEQVLILIRVGAFRFTGKTKPELMWEAHMLLGIAPVNGQERLFYLPAKSFKLPVLERNKIEDAYDEIELLGFPVSLSHFDLLKTPFRGEITAKELDKHVGKKVRMVGHMATVKYVRTVKKETMHFGTFIDHEGEFFDTTHFPDSLKKYPLRGSGLYLMYGKIVEEFGYATLEVEKLAKLPIQNDPREAD